MTPVETLHAVVMTMGALLTLLAVAHHVRTAWRARESDALVLADRLTARRRGRQGAGAAPGSGDGGRPTSAFANEVVLGSWGLAFASAVLAAWALHGEPSLWLAGTSALAAALSGVSSSYFLSRPVGRGDARVAYTVAAVLGLLGGAAQ